MLPATINLIYKNDFLIGLEEFEKIRPLNYDFNQRCIPCNQTYYKHVIEKYTNYSGVVAEYDYNNKHCEVSFNNNTIIQETSLYTASCNTIIQETSLYTASCILSDIKLKLNKNSLLRLSLYIHTGLCEHIEKELSWSVMIITLTTVSNCQQDFRNTHTLGILLTRLNSSTTLHRVNCI